VFFVFAKSISISTEDDYSVDAYIAFTLGSGIKLGSKVFSFSPDSKITVGAPGYIAHDLLLADYRGTRNIEVLLMLAPREIEVSTDKQLVNPEWFLGDEYVSSGERLTIMHKPGSFLLRLTADNIEIVNHVIEVAREGENKFVLPVKTAYRDVVIHTKPSGATVSIDGVEVGTTPYQGTLASGEYQLELSNEGYSVITHKFEMTSKSKGFEQLFNFDEKEIIVPISVSPKGGSLRVDGRVQDHTGFVSLNQLRPSTITYSLPGYRTVERNINSKPSELKIQLQPIYGELEVDANPQAQLSINGEIVGETPMRLKLTAKKHKIELQSDGYLSERKTISINEGETNSINVRLRSIKSENLKKAKEQYTNSLGITMKRFLPTPFVIGAPRSEIGQQAHEIQRRVSFTRHIYFAITEVTNAQFGKFRSQIKANTEPVSNVSWSDAALFCNWLSKKEGLQPFYVQRGNSIVALNSNSTGYRLPTEAEWEWVAKAAGKSSPTIFNWGDTYEIPEDSGNVADTSAEGKVTVFIANYTDNFATKSPVASFQENKAGVFDLFGNVSEWVHDAYGRTPAKLGNTYQDYMGPDRIGAEHVVKGSNHQSESWTELRNSFRLSMGTSSDLVGFRVARYIY